MKRCSYCYIDNSIFAASHNGWWTSDHPVWNKQGPCSSHMPMTSAMTALNLE